MSGTSFHGPQLLLGGQKFPMSKGASLVSAVHRQAPELVPRLLSVRRQSVTRTAAAFLKNFSKQPRLGKGPVPADCERLLTWLTSKSTPDQKVYVKETDTAGRGLYAAQTIRPGDAIVEVPSQFLLTADVVMEESRLGPVLRTAGWDDWALLAFFLAETKVFGSQPGMWDWSPYINVLPQMTGCVLEWTEQEVELLRGSPLHTAALDMRAAAHSAVAAATALLSSEAALQLLPPTPTPVVSARLLQREMRWGFSILLSRLVRLETAGEKLALVPWADLLNHSAGVGCVLDWEEGRAAVTLRADRLYKDGEQVFASYGAKSCGELLLSYGFCVDPLTNLHENYRLILSVSASDPQRDAKVALMHRYGWGEAEPFPLRIDALPSGLLEFCAWALVQPDTAEDLEALGGRLLGRGSGGGLLAVRGEGAQLLDAVLKQLVQVCRQSLAAYPTTMDQDRLVAQGGPGVQRMKGVRPVLQQQLAAVRVRERQILNRTIFVLQQQRKTLRSAR